jgi:Fic family protein
MDAVDELIIQALKVRPLTAREILSDLDAAGHRMSQPTLSRRMRSLEMDRQVKAQGQGRSTRYVRDPYHDWFSVAPNKRPKVGFRFELIEDYEPNVTRWIAPDASARLVAAGGGRRLDASTYSRAIAQKLLVDLSYASSAMEGNTYSYLDTQVLIEFGQAAEGKAADETQMILNHKEAIVYLIDNVADLPIDVREIKTLHALLSRGLLDPRMVGAVRNIPVDITESAYTPIAAPAVLEEQLARIATKADRIEDPFEQSLFLLTCISYLQFFRDVNKRTGRLACNIPLLKAGLAPLSFMEMDKAKYVKGLVAVYELGRVDLIAEAFCEGYVASANRYDAYAGRDRRSVELEFKRRADIYGLVKGYVSDSVEAEERGPARDYAVDALLRDHPDDDEATRDAVADRVAEIVDALHDGSHAAYGISRKLFDAYAALEPEAHPAP